MLGRNNSSDFWLAAGHIPVRMPQALGAVNGFERLCRENIDYLDCSDVGLVLDALGPCEVSFGVPSGEFFEPMLHGSISAQFERLHSVQGEAAETRSRSWSRVGVASVSIIPVACRKVR
ncbi:MAG TPA: hypothetical protein VFJ58_16045 [Armatimonadota bacterium]|nr:hypothetical protein [Armatimonadota bacterium]